MKIGYAFVIADLFHIGHLKFLQRAKQNCDWLIVGVLTDDAAASYKRRPIIPFDERVDIIQSLRCVDMVVTQSSRDPTETLKKLQEEGWNVQLLFHGDDWSEIPGMDYIKSVGGKVMRIPYYHSRSTTGIIKAIRERKSLEKFRSGEV